MQRLLNIYILNILLFNMKKGEEAKNTDECCPKFDPKPWDNKTITWKDKLFVKSKVISFFHIPLNFGMVIKKLCKKIDAAKAGTKVPIVVSDEKSPFYSNIYVSVEKPISSVHDVKVSGTFLSKVFEGPYKDMKKWIKEMEEYTTSKKKEIKHMYFYYTTCPKCAKKYGKNYVVLLAEI